MALLATRRVLQLAVCLAALVMGACGGGGGNAPPPPPAAPPTITSQPAPASVTAGQAATFNVTASGTAPLSYQWRRAGADIAGAGAASYTTPATAIGDNGALFSVVVSNAAGSVTSADAALSASLAPVAPSIATQPASVTVPAGTSATFMVAANGTAPLTYQWRRDGVDIAGASVAAYTTPVTGASDDGAHFAVVIGNPFGSVTSAAANLTVTAPAAAPAITQQPQGATTTAGQGATFSVVATGAPPLAYQWRINGAAVAGVTASVFTIATTSIADHGALVSVVVSNAAGSVSSADAALTVNPVAPPPLARYVPVWSSNDTTSSTGSYTLSVVDPAAPGTLIAVDQVPTITGNLGTILRLRGGAYDAASGLVGDVGVRNLVYVKGGSLYRVNLDKGSGPPAPMRLSTETLATGHNLHIAAASADGSDALISYLPTVGTARYVGLSAAAGSAPRTTPTFPGDSLTFSLNGWANDPATGGIATLYWRSILPSGGSRLFRTDASFGNPTSVATFSSTIDNLWKGIGVFDGGHMRHGMFFLADGALRRLDFASGNVRVVLGSVSNKIGGGVFDDSHAYLLLQTAAGVQLVRAADDDSSPGQVIASGAALSGYTSISGQTRDYLLFVTGASGDTAVSVRKTDGVLTPLPVASPPMGLSASWTTGASLFSGTAGNRVFYHYPGRIGSVAADGTDRREHGGYFLTTALLPVGLPAHRLHAWEPFTLPAARLLVQSGSSLIWLDAASGDLGVTVGSAPGIATFGNGQPPYKDWAIGRAGAIGYQVDVRVSPGTIVGRLDAIYLTDQAGSLLRLTSFIP